MSKMKTIVAEMTKRVEEFEQDEDDPDEQELLIAFIAFADAYNTFNNQQNIDNWIDAKDKQKMVLEIGNKPGNKEKLNPYMNYIWKNSPEFDNIHQNMWIYSELDRLRAPAFERLNPYAYIKMREEKERRGPETHKRQKEEPHRQKEKSHRQKEESEDNNTKFNRIYPIPTTRTHALNILNLSENATPKDIKIAFKTLSLSLHPDKHPDEQIEYTIRQQQVNAARDLLKGGKTRHTIQKKNMKNSKKSKKSNKSKKSKKSHKTKSKKH